MGVFMARMVDKPEWKRMLRNSIDGEESGSLNR